MHTALYEYSWLVLEPSSYAVSKFQRHVHCLRHPAPLSIICVLELSED